MQWTGAAGILFVGRQTLGAAPATDRHYIMPTEAFVPPEVQSEAGALLADLRAAGWNAMASRFDEQIFGNWFVDLERDGRAIRLVKDRSQFMVDGPIDELKAAGLFKAFDSLNSFREAVVAWAAPQWA